MSEIKKSKNIVTGYIDAGGNVIVGDGNTVINLKEAAQYKSLEAEIVDLNNRFNRTKNKVKKYPDDPDFREELRQIDDKRTQKQKDLKTLKQEVLKLAEDFARIPINTEHLRLAKQHFEAGEFKEARAVLDAEKMTPELNALLQRKKDLAQETEENRQLLSDKANEFLILAHLTEIDFDLPGRFEKTKEYFEESLRAERNSENIFEYAYFLHAHNQIHEAKPLYEEALKMQRDLAEINPQEFLPDVARTLNNLGELYRMKNEFPRAQSLHKKALQIRRHLVEITPQAYRSDLASTLNSLAVLYSVQYEYTQARPLYEEALNILRELTETNPEEYLPILAGTLNNLAKMNQQRNELTSAEPLYEEALQIQRELAKDNSSIYLPDVARTLNNLGELHRVKNEFTQAQPLYEEALQIRREFTNVNPHAYRPHLAESLNGMALLQDAKNEYEFAQPLYEEALQIYRQLADINPETYQADVAGLLNNLALLQVAKSEFKSAEPLYEEAIQILRELADDKPKTYLPNVAMTAANLSNLYLEGIPDKEKSLNYCREALICSFSLNEDVSIAKESYSFALKVAEDWGEDPELLIDEIRNQVNENK